MKSFIKMLWAIVVGFFLKSCDNPQNKQVNQDQEQHPTTQNDTVIIEHAETTEKAKHVSDYRGRTPQQIASRKKYSLYNLKAQKERRAKARKKYKNREQKNSRKQNRN